ncbi:ArsR/SmtB family transcription factor [Streptacidiphilus monticola]
MSSEERPERPHRKLTDPKAMRAIAHPTRLAILEALARREPLTATEVSEMVGSRPPTAPSTCARWRSTASSRRPRAAPGGAGPGAGRTSASATTRTPWRSRRAGSPPEC